MVGTPQPSVKFIGKKYMSDFTSVLLYVLTCGILYIVCHLSPQFEIYLKTKDCELAEADCVVVEDQYGNLRIFHLKRYKVSVTPGLQRYVDGKCCRILNTPYGRFIYDYKLGRFVSPNYRPGNTRDFHDIFHATACKSPNDEMLELYEKRIIYGENDLFLPLPSTLNIIKERMVEWIFLWEIFSMVVWISIKYYIYATVVGCLYLFVLIRKIKRDIEHRDEQLANNKRNTVRVMRGGAFCRISEEEVLPGDLIYIDITESFKCDVEILHGSVISDESFLTGETVPIFKCAHSQVYCGSRIIKSMGGVATAEDSTPFQKLVKVKNLLRKGRFTEYKDERQSRLQLDDVAVGIVVGTGKKTKKGNMLKNIMIRRPAFNVFIVQSHSIIKCLLAASIVIMIVLATYLSLYVPPARNFRFAIDLAIAFFSPALYSTLEMGVQYAKEELLKKRISTTDAGRINTAGEVDMVVFDKTGTLTESTVDILCIDTLSERIEEFSQLNEIEQLGISTCHYVMELENQYSGDILDMKMFMFSNSTIINIDEKRYIVPTTTHIYEPICQGEIHSETENPHVFIVSADIGPTNWQPQIEVVKIFDFDSYLKRMSVVVKTAKSKCFLFCKGAPDSLRKILESVPEGYDERVNEYGLQGYRVITLAYREIDGCPTREMGEQNLRFCGFVVFANRLKEETCGVIAELRGAGIMSKMCTGDNILTAISVARECGMIDRETPVLFPVVEDEEGVRTDAEWYCVAEEDYIFDKVKLSLHSEFDRSETVEFVVACEGREYEMLKGTVYQGFILERGAIFARFNPENKKCLIEDYSGTHHTTMYCGDGANDTGALSVADVGLSLATNEASLAASFNSANLTAVLELVREGRSALAMSAAQFKYMFYAQALCGVQMASLLPFFYFPADMMSLVTDLMSGYVLGSALYHFKSANTIHSCALRIDLRTDCLFLAAELCFIYVVLFIVNYSFGFSSVRSDITIESKNSTATFITVMFILIYKAYVCADFGPHRQRRSKNLTFILTLLGCTIFCSVLTCVVFNRVSNVLRLFQTTVLSRLDSFRIFLEVLFCLSISFFFNVIKRPMVLFGS